MAEEKQKKSIGKKASRRIFYTIPFFGWLFFGLSKIPVIGSFFKSIAEVGGLAVGGCFLFICFICCLIPLALLGQIGLGVSDIASQIPIMQDQLNSGGCQDFNVDGVSSIQVNGENATTQCSKSHLDSSFEQRLEGY